MQWSQRCFPFPLDYEYQEKKKKKYFILKLCFLNTESCPILTAGSPASINALKQCIKREYTVYSPKYLQCLETSVLCQEKAIHSTTQGTKSENKNLNSFPITIAAFMISQGET